VRIEDRFQEGFSHDKPRLIDRLKRRFAGIAEQRLTDDNRLDIDVAPGIVAGAAAVERQRRS
jgi:hypothetical protein